MLEKVQMNVRMSDLHLERWSYHLPRLSSHGRTVLGSLTSCDLKHRQSAHSSPKSRFRKRRSVSWGRTPKLNCFPRSTSNSDLFFSSFAASFRASICYGYSSASCYCCCYTDANSFRVKIIYPVPFASMAQNPRKAWSIWHSGPDSFCTSISKRESFSMPNSGLCDCELYIANPSQYCLISLLPWLSLSLIWARVMNEALEIFDASLGIEAHLQCSEDVP